MITPKQLLDKFREEDAKYSNGALFTLREVERIITAHTTEDDMEDAIEHYAIGGSPIDYTPEDEPSRIEHGTCVTNCPTCGWQGRENESHTANPPEDECENCQGMPEVTCVTCGKEPNTDESRNRYRDKKYRDILWKWSDNKEDKR